MERAKPTTTVAAAQEQQPTAKESKATAAYKFTKDKISGAAGSAKAMLGSWYTYMTSSSAPAAADVNAAVEGGGDGKKKTNATSEKGEAAKTNPPVTEKKSAMNAALLRRFSSGNRFGKGRLRSGSVTKAE